MDNRITVEWLCNMLIAECPVKLKEGVRDKQLDSFLAGEVQNSPYRNNQVSDYRFTSEYITIWILI